MRDLDGAPDVWDGSAELEAEYQAHLDAGRCPDCAMGLYPQYGVAPHVCFYRLGKNLGESETLPRDQWPANFREDPECPGLGTYECPRCSGVADHG